MEKYFILLLFLLLIIFFIPLISADVISINSGGGPTGQIIIGPDVYIEGFFSGTEYAAICGNGVLEGTEQCDDGNIVNGDGCSSVCITETEEEETPEGGGSGGGGTTPSLNIVVSPVEFDINLAVNTTSEKTITITNLGTSSVTVTLAHTLEDHFYVRGENVLILQAGQSKTFRVVFVALSEPGVFTGVINIGGKNILVSINVASKLLLFDSNIVVLNKGYLVEQGDNLKTRVTLIPLGDSSRLDVTLNYIIKNYRNEVFLTKSETLLIEETIKIDRDFDTGILEIGDYVVALELVYPNGLAPSSAHFEVIEQKPINIFTRLILFLVILIIIILILILIVIIWRRIEAERVNSPPVQSK